MFRLFFIFLFSLTFVNAQELKVYLDIERSQNNEMNFLTGDFEPAWDLPTKSEIRSEITVQMGKRDFLFEIVARERNADYTVEMDGTGWVLINEDGRIVAGKKNAIRFSNTAKDIVLEIRTFRR